MDSTSTTRGTERLFNRGFTSWSGNSDRSAIARLRSPFSQAGVEAYVFTFG